MSDKAENNLLPAQGRLLGFDYGTVRVGIAWCDEGQKIASPYETYTRRNEELDQQFFVKLASDTGAVGLVVGLPVHMSGDESQKSMEARAFGNWLGEITQLPVTWVDERYSTAFARELLRSQNLTGKKAKGKLDKVAAQSILTVYLESSGNSNTGASENLED